MKNWKQYIFWHSCTGVVEPAFWRHTSVYILEDNRKMGLLTQLSDVTPLCVENNAIFTQMLETNIIFTQMLEYKRTFVCREQYNIYTDAWKQKNLLCHLGNEWRHTFQTFLWCHGHTRMRNRVWDLKLWPYSQFPTTNVQLQFATDVHGFCVVKTCLFFLYLYVYIFFSFIVLLRLMRRSNCSAPIPPLGTPGTSLFFVVAPGFLSP